MLVLLQNDLLFGVHGHGGIKILRQTKDLVEGTTRNQD